MNVVALVEDLSHRGVRLWAEGDELRCRGSKKVLTSDVLAQLKAHREEILNLLRPSTAKAPEAVSDQDPCHHEVAGGCWLCEKYSFKLLRPPTPTVAEVLENPPYWLESYLRGFWRGGVSLCVLSGAVAAAMGLSPYQWAEELMAEVEVLIPELSGQPERMVAASGGRMHTSPREGAPSRTRAS
jgi:hypothetical protein